MQHTRGISEERSSKNGSVTQKKEIVVTVTSSMSNSINFTVNVPLSATVAELKHRCCLSNPRLIRQIFVFDGKELSNDNAKITEYGMHDNCTVQVFTRMESGRISSANTPSDIMNMARIIFFTPFLLPEPSKSMTNLRKTIRVLHNKGSSSAPQTDQQLSSPQKNIEHMLTRKRMKDLMEKRRQQRAKKRQRDGKESSSPQQSVAKLSGSTVGMKTAVEPAQSGSGSTVIVSVSNISASSTSLSTVDSCLSTAGSSVSSETASSTGSSVAGAGVVAKKPDGSTTTSSLMVSMGGTSADSSGLTGSPNIASLSGGYFNSADAGSICGSINHSPLGGSAPSTPDGSTLSGVGMTTLPNFTKTTDRPSKSETSGDDGDDARPMTKKELLSYYDPPETKKELETARRTFYDPPQDRDELQKMKEKMSALCGVCRRRLPVAVRSIVCACGTSFCNRHREKHNCSVDYKHTGRGQIEQQNPKISGRKGLLSEDDK